jgi:hypothetical protein
VPEPAVRHVPPTEKHPAVRLIPFAKVEVELPVIELLVYRVFTVIAEAEALVSVV